MSSISVTSTTFGKRKATRNEEKTLGDWDKVTKPGLVSIAQILGLKTDKTATELRSDIFNHYRGGVSGSDINAGVAAWVRKSSSLPGYLPTERLSVSLEPHPKRARFLPDGLDKLAPAEQCFRYPTNYPTNYAFDNYISGNLPPLASVNPFDPTFQNFSLPQNNGFQSVGTNLTNQQNHPAAHRKSGDRVGSWDRTLEPGAQSEYTLDRMDHQ